MKNIMNYIALPFWIVVIALVLVFIAGYLLVSKIRGLG